MKTIAAEGHSSLHAVLDSAQKERILLTRDGKPSAVVVGIESYDAEDWQLVNSTEFWRMIEQRRREGKSIPMAEARKRLSLPRARKVKTKSPKR
jgi:prevent-host-death family protein